MNLLILQGLFLGAIIGSVYAWLQILSFRQRDARAAGLPTEGWHRFVPSSVTCGGVLLTALLGVQVFLPAANNYWLTASLLLCAGVPLFYRLMHLRRQSA